MAARSNVLPRFLRSAWRLAWHVQNARTRELTCRDGASAAPGVTAAGPLRLAPLWPALNCASLFGFVPMHAMTSTKQGVSAVEISRRLGVSYPTGWYLEKRLRHAMTEREGRYLLGEPNDAGAVPVVEADDVYLGGERNQGSGPAGKTAVIAAAERHVGGRMGHVAMKVVEGFSSSAVKAFREICIANGALVHTDGLRAFMAFGEAGCSHQRSVTGSKRPARARGAPFFVVNTAIANLSTALKATHKTISAKHANDYLGAFCWTTNRRRDMTGMVPALCRAATTASRLTRRSVYAAQAVSLG